MIGSLSHRMTALAAEERFEDAGSFRDRLAAFLRGAARTQRLRALTRCPRSSPPAATTTAGGRCTSCATAGWPPPG